MATTKAETHNEQEEGNFTLIPGQSIFKNYLDMPVWQLRHLAVSRFIDSHDIRRVLDIGCAEGTLINRLSRSSSIQQLIGLDLDEKVLQKAKMNIQPQLLQDNIGFIRKNPLIAQLYQLDVFGQLPLQNFRNIQLVTMIQFIQHVKQQDLPQLCSQVFDKIRPNYVIITTPNQQFNAHFRYKPGQMRHPQHLYQWTRAQFKQFCSDVSDKYEYHYQIFGIGEHISDKSLGQCSQGAYFTRLKPKQQIQCRQLRQKSDNINPIEKIRYPFWKDTINARTEGEIRNLLIINNYQSPQVIGQQFKHTKIGKKIIQIQEQSIQEEKHGGIDKYYIIGWVRRMKYCGYCQERDQVFYQYEDSMQEQDYYGQQDQQIGGLLTN